MARYLIVAHQTACSPELLERVKSLAAADPAAEFTLLVPATPTGPLLHNWEEGEARARARGRGRGRRAPRGGGGRPPGPGGGGPPTRPWRRSATSSRPGPAM